MVRFCGYAHSGQHNLVFGRRVASERLEQCVLLRLLTLAAALRASPVQNKYAEIVDVSPSEIKLLSKTAGELDEKSCVRVWGAS